MRECFVTFSLEISLFFLRKWRMASRCASRGSHVRVIVVRHPAPPAGKDIPVGKRVGEWVYELFITMLDAEGFLVEDVLDLYHGRGAEDRGAGR